MEKNKKTWLVVLVVLAVGAAVAAGLTMGGKLFKGDIGAGPSTCEEGGKGCPDQPCEGKGCPENITRAEWVAYLTRGTSDTKALNDCKVSPFSDTQGNKYEKYICYATQVGWIQGNADGTFKPEDYVTRAEGAKTISKVFGIMWINPKAQAPDIKTASWYFDYANTLIKYKFPTTKQNENFYPADSLTKQDAQSWVLHAKKVTSTATTPATPVTSPKAVTETNINRSSLIRSVVQAMPGYSQSQLEKCTANLFSDLKAGSYEAKFACYAYEAGIIKQVKKFNPTNTVSRAEGLKMIEVAFEVSIGGPVLGCSDVNYDTEWWALYFDVAQSNQFPNISDTNGKCNPSANLTTTDAKAWIKHAKSL